MSGLFTYLFQSFGTREQVPDRGLVCQYPTHHAQYVERRPAQLAVVFDNGDKTVCDDCNINLYSHGILSSTPKREHFEMLFYPPEEQFHLPTLLVQQGDILCLEREVVRQERERSPKVRSIVNYPPQFSGILLLGLIASKAYRLVKENIILAIQQILSVNHLVVEPGLLSNDKVGADKVDLVQPVKVVIPLVKDVERKRLIRNVIHRLHIMDFGLRNVNVGWYLGHNVKQRVNLDSALGLSEVSPLEQAQAEVNRGGVEGIETSMQLEFPVKPLALRKIDHVVGELLEDPVIPVGIGVSDIAQFDVATPETEMVTLILDGINEAHDFPKTVTAGKLAVHHHKELVPAREGLHILVAIVLLYDSIKDSLGQKLNELTEHIFSAIHACLGLIPAAKFGNQFKSTRAIFACN